MYNIRGTKRKKISCQRNVEYRRGRAERLTEKKPGGIGPPGMPSFGGICPSGEGAGPAFCESYRALSVSVIFVGKRIIRVWSFARVPALFARFSVQMMVKLGNNDALNLYFKYHILTLRKQGSGYFS